MPVVLSLLPLAAAAAAAAIAAPARGTPRLGHGILSLHIHLNFLLIHFARRLHLVHLAKLLVDLLCKLLARHTFDAPDTLLDAAVRVDDELDLLQNISKRGK